MLVIQMDSNRVDLLIKYALVVAGQEDPGNRELGPIHLVKYVYLADLGYADAHDGQTFTSAPWRFHHFGPWTELVYERIEPVVRAVAATERRFTTPGYDDGVRWTLQDEGALREVERQLPWEAARAVKKAVHEFGSDTHALLHYVYTTRPIRRAAPGDLLDFSPAEAREPADASTEETWARAAAPPSKTALKHRRVALDNLRERVQAKLAQRPKELAAPSPPPRYDELFREGQQWLDSLSGEPIREEHGELTISEEVWKSRGRSEPGIP